MKLYYQNKNKNKKLFAYTFIGPDLFYFVELQ